MRSFSERMIGAAKLDISVYEEVEHDPTATSQAGIVVGIVAIASAIGGIGGGPEHALRALIAAVIGWGLWSGITYLIGDKLLGGTATWGELLRTLGFAQTPGMLYALGAIPIVGWYVIPVIAVYLLFTGVVAIRQALDFGTGRAILTALLGLIPYGILRFMLEV